MKGVIGAIIMQGMQGMRGMRGMRGGRFIWIKCQDCSLCFLLQRVTASLSSSLNSCSNSFLRASSCICSLICTHNNLLSAQFSMVDKLFYWNIWLLTVCSSWVDIRTIGRALTSFSVWRFYLFSVFCSSPWPSVFSVVNRFYLTALSVSNVAIDYWWVAMAFWIIMARLNKVGLYSHLCS